MPKSLIDIDYIRATGTSSSGEIFFYPPRVKAENAMVSQEPIRAVVENGKGSVELVQLPNGYTYRAVERISKSSPYSFHFALSSTSPSVIQYEDIAPVDSVPATYTVVRSVNGLSPDPTTGNVVIEVAGTPGPKGDDGLDGVNGTNGTNGTDGVDGVDGTMKDQKATPRTNVPFGPAGDSGPWTPCPPAYRPEPISASPGDRLQWYCGFLHQNSAEAAYDIASIVDGVPARCLSSGTAVPLSGGYGGMYIAAGWPRSLTTAWFTVTADDIDVDGKVTLALMYRDSGSGNTMGNVNVPGDVIVTNMGGGA